MPSPLRALVLTLTAVCISVALCVCIRAAVMLYEWYRILQWCSEAVA